MFLATTALREFWRTDGPISFLGPWCLRKDDERHWRGLDYRVLPCAWSDRAVFRAAGEFTWGIYNELLELLARLLNELHGCHHTRRYWQIIIGPWLNRFVEAFYDRWYCLKRAYEQNGTYRSMVLDEACWITPRDALDFSNHAAGDFYNLQLYSQILSWMGVNCERLRHSASDQVYTVRRRSRGWFLDMLRRFVFLLLQRVGQNRPVLLWDLYLEWSDIYRLVRASRGKAWPVLADMFDVPRSRPVAGGARQLLRDLAVDSEFARCLVEHLPINFPTLYLEDYTSFSESVARQFPQSPQGLLSANGWYWNECFKFAAARWSEQGTALLGSQHGGIYGTAAFVPSERTEVEISERFFSWGWTDAHQPKVRSVSNPRISRLRSVAKPKADVTSDLLFIGTTHPRYLYTFQTVPVAQQFEDYVDARNIFLGALSSALRERVLVRLLPVDFGRGEIERLSQVCPTIRIDDRSLGPVERMARSRMVIIDHPVTSMLESLAMNRPTLLYWDPDLWELREDAVPFFQSLHQVRIWHHGPEEAAHFLNSVEAELEQWWWSTTTQEARNRFVGRFAIAGGSNVSDEWWREIREGIGAHVGF